MERLNIDNSFHDSGPQDPEISLGAATILGIFLALTLVCALFFGLGYSMGRKSAQTATGVSSEATATLTTKPAPGNLGANAPAPMPPAAATPVANPTASPTPATAVTVPLTPAQNQEQNGPKTTPPPAIPTGNFIVQIAAVSHREDAESLIAALEQRGYTVFLRNEPQDKLLHVQVGPFPTRRDADAMRQHLLYDGYNAIVK